MTEEENKLKNELIPINNRLDVLSFATTNLTYIVELSLMKQECNQHWLKMLSGGLISLSLKSHPILASIALTWMFYQTFLLIKLEYQRYKLVKEIKGLSGK